MDKTDFAKRMKEYEKVETQQRFDNDLPLVVRLDGRGFSKFTKGMTRPFDVDFREIMEATAEYLSKKTDAIIAYTQSDEITLVYNPNRIFFNGKKQKVVSTLAAMASAFFAVKASQVWPEKVEKSLPTFDCRAYNVESRNEAVNGVLWRVKDCRRNAISMVAHANFSHKDLHKKSSREMVTMLKLRKDIDMDQIDGKFRNGIFIMRKNELQYIDDVTWNKIPVAKRPDDRFMTRSVYIKTYIEDPTFSELYTLMYEEVCDD